MRFLRARIQDFRSIEDLELDFTEPGSVDEPLPIAVLVGPNGSGKTAVLEALVRSSWLFCEEDAEKGSRRFANELRARMDKAQIATRVRITETESRLFARRVSEFNVHMGRKPLPEVQLPPALEVLTTLGPDGWLTQRLTEIWTELRLSERLFASMASTPSPPSIVYLDAARHAPRNPIETVTAARDVDRAQYAASPSIGTDRHQWTKQRLVNLKFSQMLARDRGSESDVFDRLWAPVEALLEHIWFREITDDLRIIFDTRSGTVEFDDLSSGEKSIVLMFVDLHVRDLEQAVVLIDEVELHLHPSWQARILEALRKAIPTCQLIVTTQSPIVAASVKESKYLFDLGRLSSG